MDIGIIGYGMVGQATGKALKKLIPSVSLFIYDIDPEKCRATKRQLEVCDYILICIPTKNHEQTERDLRAAIRGFDPWKVVIRSTVPPSIMRKRPFCNTIAWPEFLTARFADNDSLYPSRMVIGGKEPENFIRDVIKEGWKRQIPIYQFDTPAQAMAVKFAANVYGAVKITYWNMIYQWVGKENFDRIKTAAINDNWPRSMHTNVPGPDGKLGFGGACLPKDTRMLAMEMLRSCSSSVLFATLGFNNMVRV